MKRKSKKTIPNISGAQNRLAAYITSAGEMLPLGVSLKLYSSRAHSKCKILTALSIGRGHAGYLHPKHQCD